MYVRREVTVSSYSCLNAHDSTNYLFGKKPAKMAAEEGEIRDQARV